MMKNLICLLFLSASAVSCFQAGNDGKCVTTESLLNEMVSYDAVVSWPEPEYRTAQVSSYDRRTTKPDEPGWFANDDGFGFERIDSVHGRTEKVLFDEKGPGAITRIWMTTRDKTGTLRFYFDGSDEPDITVDAYDMDRFPVNPGIPLSLTHTHYDANLTGVGGNTFFLPIPYSESCKITLEETSGKNDIPRYYQITYRKYPDGTDVNTFSLKQARNLAPEIERICKRLLNTENFTSGTECIKTFSPTKTSDSCLDLPAGNNAVRYLSLNIKDLEDSSALHEIMRNSYIKMKFDGVECVDCPLDCFFGAGTGTPAVDGWYLTSDGKGRFSSRWVMPYRDNAEICIVNASAHCYKAVLTCYVDDYEMTDNTLYFHASYREQAAVPTGSDYNSNDNIEWNFASVKGRGIYCGDILSLYNHCPSWYGEGDEKIWIDDDIFPSIMGTGTEDYFNCSWAPVVPFDTPFGGAPRADEDSSHGYNTFMRTRNLDIMPFRESLVFDLEMLSWVPGTVDYRAASYWYGDLDTLAE